MPRAAMASLSSSTKRSGSTTKRETGKLDNRVALANSAFENLVGVSLGHMEELNRQLRIRNH